MIDVILPASGIGSRSNLAIPKQFFNILGHPIIYYTVKKFSEIEEVNKIYIGIQDDWAEYCEQCVSEFSKCIFVKGGLTRHHTIQNIVKRLDNEHNIIIIHDIVRPLIQESMILDIYKAAQKYSIAGFFRPLSSTILSVNKDNFMETSLVRSEHIESHTPQAFKYNIIKEIYSKIIKEDLEFGTECLHLAQKYCQCSPKMIEGDYRLQKITYKEDMHLVEHYLKYEEKNVALVTGGSKGIGLSIAKKLIYNNFIVIICSRSQENLDKAKELVKGIDTYVCNVCKENEIDNLFGYIFSKYKKLDVLVNNAGIAVNKKIENTTRDEFRDVLDTNLYGSFKCIQNSFKHMKTRKGGIIINIGSSSIEGGRSGMSVYTASKAALVSLTDSIALEGKQYNIIGISIIPKRTNTELRQEMFPDEDKECLLNPENVADGVIMTIIENVKYLSGNKFWIK